MKTAEEWTKEAPFNFQFIDDIEPMTRRITGDFDLVNNIRAIQIDALEHAQRSQAA